MTIDVHQHLWPAPFLAALRARRTAPRLEGWELSLPGERPYAIDPADHDPAARAAQAADRRRRAGARGAVRRARARPPARRRSPPSSPPRGSTARSRSRRRSAPGPWPAPPRPSRPRCEAALDRGAVGLEVAADVLAAPDGPRPPRPAARRCSTRRGARCSSTPARPARRTTPGRPGWWAPVVPYVAQLHAAWWAWADAGPRPLPRAAGLLRRARRPRAAARRAPPRPRRDRPARRPARVRRDVVLRHAGRRRRHPRARHRRRLPRLRPPVRRGGRCPALGDAAVHAIRTSNPGRLLAHVPQEVSA